jgi:hypothetical protein
MKRLAATLALGLLVALLVVGTGVASAAGTAGQDSATGHVTDATMVTVVQQPPVCFPFPVGCIPQPPQQFVNAADVDFSAKSSYNGTNPTGSARFTFRNEDPDQQFSGEVTCLDVQGGFARLSGPITEARGGSTLTVGTQAFEPRSFVITAFDSGKFSTQPDSIGFVLSPQPATDVTCTTQGTQTSPVRDGDVVVKDSLG